MAKYISKINIRPCIKRKPLFIEAGTEFEGSMLDKDSLQQMIDAGTVLPVEEKEAPAAPPVSPRGNKAPAASPVSPRGNKATAVPPAVPPADTTPPPAAPVGIWKYKRAGIEKLNVDVLNALAKETADNAGIPFAPINDKEELLALLCSENGEQETKG